MLQWRLLLLMHWFHSMMVLVAMIGAFRQIKNQQTMPSWHSPPQVLLVLIMSLGYDNQVFNSLVFDCDELISSESDVSMPTSPVHDRPSVKPVEHPTLAKNLRKDILKSRGHRHSWNRKACFVCKSLTHLIKDCDYYEKKMVQKPVRNHTMRGNHQRYARMTHPHPHRHVVTTTVFTRHVVTTTVLTRSRLVPLNAARPVNTAVPQTKGVKGNWVWKPKCPVLERVSRHTSASMTLKQFDYTDALGRSNVSQMYDKKNSVLFIDTECIVLPNDFKLPNENQVLLRVPKENNVYNVDLKNIVPSGDLTCLFAKATLAEVVYTACYVQNRVLVTKPHNKTPYELLHGRTHSIGFMRPFGCLVTILNTLDPLGKFDGKADEGFLVGYSVSSKAFSVFNSRTRIVQETMHINFLENQPNVAGSGPIWLFDIDTLTQSMNYQPVVTRNQPNFSAGIQENLTGDPQNINVAAFEVKEPEPEVHVFPRSCDKTKKHDDKTKREAKGKSHVGLSTGVRDLSDEFKEFFDNNTNGVNAASTLVTAVGPNSTNNTNTFSDAGPSNNVASLNFKLGGKSSFVDPSQYPNDPDRHVLEDITYSDDEEDVGGEADFSNLETNIAVSPIPIARVHKDHPVTQIIVVAGNQPNSSASIQENLDAGKNIDADAAFADKENKYEVHVSPSSSDTPKKHDEKAKREAKEKSHVELSIGVRDLSEEFEEFSINNTNGVNAASTPVTAVGLNSANNTNSLSAAGPSNTAVNIIYFDDKEDVGAEADFSNLETSITVSPIPTTRVHKDHHVTQIIGLQVKQKQDGIFISQDKYVAKILRKFGLRDGKSASTLIDTEKPLLKDPDGEDLDVHTYRSMIGSLMYLTSSRPDNMFAICACACFQVTPKASHLHAVKKIFSDYARSSLDRKSTTGGCQFLGCTLISWQCKKQTVVATSFTEAQYVAAASYCD
nr:hypothetical protein [Tanacetum cinerariifolium]